MAKAIDTLSIKLDLKGLDGGQKLIDKLKSSFKGLEQVVVGSTAPAIKKLRQQVNSFAAQGNKSISTIDAQVTALRALRREADINSKEFRELTADIKKYEAQLQKAQGRKGGAGKGALRATQTAGAVISGGIFGGPEGALGGLLGAPFGVSGAFAGAAIGAQIGGLRQATAGTADYAAQIEKLKIALDGVSGSTENYNSALAAARQVTESLNVPQDAAIGGITRLVAAVRGAGGPMQDAELTFKNVTAAIKATGGSTEDVKGAITAMVQVFSKGKVSAEELSGQLGERLPGAVTLFAKANNMSLQELQENLKKGTVGLNELMRFIAELGNKYGETAVKISDSNADAGARLSVAIADMQADIGSALIPIGAQFQEAFSEFITTITPFLREALPQIGNLLLGISRNFDTLAVAAASALGVLSVAKIAAIVTSIKSLSLAKIALLRNVVLLKKGFMALNLTLLKNPFVALAAGVALFATKVYQASQEQKRFNRLVKEGTQAETEAELNSLYARRAELEPKAYSKQTITIKGQERQVTGDAVAAAELQTINKRIRQLSDPSVLNLRRYDATQGAPIDQGLLQPFDYGSLAGEDVDVAGTGGTTRKDITKAAADAQIAALEMRRKGVLLTHEQIRAQADLARAAAESLKPQEKRVKLKQIDINESNRIFNLEEQIAGIGRQMATELAQDMERAKELEKERATALREVQLITGEITQEQFDQQEAIARAAELTELLPDHYEKVKEALEQAATPLGRFKEGLKEVFESALNLNDALATRGVEAVQQFGDAFADFVATGKTSFAELTQSILQDLARIFARAALFQALSFIPGVGNFLGLSGGGGGGNFEFTGGSIYAKGGVFAKNKIVPFAYGGIVKKPMLFPMANGAGLMGEAGPEAIMPLRRGRDGRLGVEASGGIGNVVVNVDASGSSVQGDQPNAKALGSAIGIAVQAELVRQKRPGGLLS